MVFRDTTTADVNFDVAAREKESEEQLQKAQAVADMATDTIAVGAIEGATEATAGSVARRLGIGSELGIVTPGAIAKRMRDNPLMSDWETYWQQKNKDVSGDPNWARQRANSMRRVDLTSWVSSMNPDLPATYKNLGIPANAGVEETELPSGEKKYGNATWQDSPIYKSSPEFWDTYERWSKTPYSQVAEELRQSIGPDAVIDEQIFRQKVNSYRQLVNSTREVEKLQQIAEYPEDGGFVRDFKAYVDEWDRLDKSGGFAGGVANWIEDVKLMGEGTYQVLLTMSGISDPVDQTDRQFGKELGESFTSGLAGGITASLQKDPETGELRVARKPLILLGTIAPTMWNLAKAAKGGYLTKPVAQQLDVLKKQDSRFAKAFNATLDAVGKVKAKTVDPVTAPIKSAARKLDEIELPSFIRKDEKVGRGDIDMPDQRGIKVDPEGPIDFTPDKLRPGSDRQLRTVGDVTRAAIKDLGFWSITGLPFYNLGAASALVGASGLSRIGYGALLKASPKALNAHRKLRQYFTRSGKLQQLDNVDERVVQQGMRDFAEAMQGQFSEDVYAELVSYMNQRAKGLPPRALDLNEVAGMEIPAEAREVTGRAYSEAQPLDQADRVSFGEFGPMVDARLVRERELTPREGRRRTRKPGQAIKIGRPAKVPQELLDQKANLTSRLQEIEALLGAEESTSPASVPLSRKEDRFGVTEAEKQYYPKPDETERTSLAVDRVEALDQLAEVNRAIEEAEAQPPSREVSAMESPIAADEVAMPEREVTTVRVGNKDLEAITEAEGFRRDFERRAAFVRQAAEEAREAITPRAIREEIRKRGAPQTDLNIENITNHYLESIDIAERTVIEEFRYRNNVPVDTERQIADNINELTVQFADETVAALLDQGQGASGKRTVNPVEAAQFYAEMKESLKEQANQAYMIEENGFNQDNRKMKNTLRLFRDRFTQRDIDNALRKEGIEGSFSPTGDLITDGPLFELAQGKLPATTLRTKDASVTRPGDAEGRKETFKIAAADQPTRQEMQSPLSEPRKPTAEIAKTERRLEDSAASQPEQTKVNMLNEETGLWEDVNIQYPDLNLSGIKFNEKRLQQLQTEDGARALQRIAIERELGKKPTSFLVKSGRSRGLVKPSEQQQLRLFVEEGQTSSIANFRKKLIDKITNDRMKEDTGRLSFVRKLAKMTSPELDELAAKQSPAISFKKTKARPAIRKNADKVQHILTVLKRRKDKGVPEAQQKLDGLIRRRDELESQIRQSNRRPIKGFEDEGSPRSFEQVERSVDRAELAEVNENIRRARSELNNAQVRDRTIRLRDTERGSKQQRDSQEKLEKARKEVKDLTEQQVLEELQQYDPKTEEAYRLKKTQRQGATEPALSVTVPGPDGESVTYGFSGTRDVPTAKEALARFKASGAKQSKPSFKFKKSTQEVLANKLLAKYEKRLKKEQPQADAPTDSVIGYDSKIEAALSQMTQAVPGKGPVASIVRMLRKYIETEGGQKADFNVDRLNKALVSLEKTKKGESPVQLKQFDKRPKKTKAEEPAKKAKAEEPKAETKPKKSGDEKNLDKLKSRVDSMYDAVINQVRSARPDYKQINRALIPISSVYGQVARLQLPLDVKRPLLEKLRDVSQQIADSRRSNTFSAKFETISDELQALVEGEIVPELMSVSRGTFSVIQEAFTNKKTGIFTKLDKAVAELKANYEASTDAGRPKTAQAYANALDDRVSILARSIEELEEGSVHSIADRALGIREDGRFDRFDEYGPNMFMRKTAGQERSVQMAKDPQKGALARSFGLSRLDGNYYLDSDWYRSRSEKPREAVDAAIAAEVVFRDMQKTRRLLETKLAEAQQVNAKTPGTREYFAAQAADVITNPVAKMPKDVEKTFKKEIYKLQQKVDNNETIPIRKTLLEINESDLSPAEKYALYRQVNAMHLMQESHGPGIVKSTGETRIEAKERAFMNSPIVTNASMIIDADGTKRPSKRMVVRLVRPWSRGFDAKMLRYTKKMEKLGRSEMERNAFVANVMELFNQGNSLLMSPAFRKHVSNNVAKNISDQLVAAYATDALGKKRKGLSNTEMQTLENNITEFLAEYALPFSGAPPAARFSKGTVNASRMLASMPTKFEFMSGDVTLATADLISIIEKSFDEIKSEQTKLLIMQDAARNLSGRLQSQAKASAFVSMNNNEMDRFKVAYSDTPLEALAKYTYRTVFRNEARPMSLVYALAEEPMSTKIVYVDKGKILDSHSGKFDEFVDAIQQNYHDDLQEIFKDKYNESYAVVTPEVVERHNAKHKTAYTPRLTKDQIESAFGGLDSISQSSPVGTFIRDMEENTFSLNNMSKELKTKSDNPLLALLEKIGQPERSQASALQKEIQEAMPLTSRIYTELSKDLGVTDSPNILDSQIEVSPQGLSTDRIFSIPMNKGFLESVAWDAKLSRDMQSMMGKSTSIMKAGLTVRSAVTQLGNIVGNSLAIGMTTGEDMASLGLRIARTERLFYAHAKNPDGFLGAAQKLKLSKETRDIVEAVESISANTALDAMDSFNVEIGTAAQRSVNRAQLGIEKSRAGEIGVNVFDAAVSAPKSVMKLQDFMYKHGDAAPRRAEVLREYLEGRQMLEAMEPGSAMAFRVSRKGYTTFYKDNKGIYQLSKQGKKTYSDLKSKGVDDFTSKVLASHAVQKVSGRIFNYRNVPRFIEMVRSGGFGALGSLFFSQFISFPYLAVDGFGKKGLAASTIFEPFFDNDVITNSKKVMLNRSYNQTLRGVRRGMVMTAFQSMRYPESEALQEDSKFRRDANTMGAVLPSKSEKPGFYRYFSWSNANGYDTTISLLNYALGMQAWLASEADKVFGGKGDSLNEFGKTMLAQVAAKERGQTRELLDLMTFGGSVLGSFLVDYNKDFGHGSTQQRFLATVFGKDQSRFFNALLTKHTDMSPSSDESVYKPIMQERLASEQEGQWKDMTAEEKSKLLNDNFWPIIFNLRLREKRIIDPRKVSQEVRNKAIDTFTKGLEDTLYEGVTEASGLDVPRAFAADPLKPKLMTARDEEEKNELDELKSVIKAHLTDPQGGIVTALQNYYEAIDTYDTRQKAYKKAVKSDEKESRLKARRAGIEAAREKVKTTRETAQAARRRAAAVKIEVDREKKAINRRAKVRNR
jgi:hypothetical protein